MQQVRREMERKGTTGALRRQLGVKEGQTIPSSWLSRIANKDRGEIKCPTQKGGKKDRKSVQSRWHP